MEKIKPYQEWLSIAGGFVGAAGLIFWLIVGSDEFGKERKCIENHMKSYTAPIESTYESPRYNLEKNKIPLSERAKRGLEKNMESYRENITSTCKESTGGYTPSLFILGAVALNIGSQIYGRVKGDGFDDDFGLC